MKQERTVFPYLPVKGSRFEITEEGVKAWEKAVGGPYTPTGKADKIAFHIGRNEIIILDAKLFPDLA